MKQNYFCSQLNYNINGSCGGAAGLVLLSEQRGSKAFIVRSGVDCNNFSTSPIKETYRKGDFGPVNKFETDEKGTLLVNCLWGSNHACVFTNDSRYGNLRNCVFVLGSDSPTTTLPVKVRSNVCGEVGSSLTLVVCSGGTSESVTHALCLVGSRADSREISTHLVCGKRTFEFSEEGGMLHVKGPEGSRYGVCHSRNDLEQCKAHAYVAQKQSVDGTSSVILCDKVTEHATFVVLCSNSCGLEDSSIASIYFVTVNSNATIVAEQIAGLHSKIYTSSDLWTFDFINNQLQVRGPGGPCKYGLMSNISATTDELKSTLQQSSCLATGESTQTIGKVKITQNGVSGIINKWQQLKLYGTIKL